MSRRTKDTSEKSLKKKEGEIWMRPKTHKMEKKEKNGVSSAKIYTMSQIDFVELRSRFHPWISFIHEYIFIGQSTSKQP